MKKDKLIRFLQNGTLNYRDLLSEFIECYFNFVKILSNKVHEKKCSEKEEYIIKKLEYWLEEDGYELFFDAVGQLSAQDEYKIEGFIELYRFLLLSSSDSVEKLIDHLFYIPGQFFNEFMSEKKTLIGKIDEHKTYFTDDKDNNYTIIKKGIFNEIPFLLNLTWRTSYEY